MGFGEDIGPKQVVIPEQRFYSCWSCKFYSHQMVKSGQHPIYESTCEAMDSTGKAIVEEPNVIVLFKYKLNDTRTPDCCPYLKPKQREDKIDTIL